MARERHAAIETAERCGVGGCAEQAVRSIPATRVTKAGLALAEGMSPRAPLCRAHYRQFKKATREERELESLGR